MYNDADPHDERFFPPEDMVNASELREFLYCERAWFLSRQGLRVSCEFPYRLFHRGLSGS
jgi:hypothetical protein